MLKYFTSFCLTLCVLSAYSQDKPIDLQPKDTVPHNQKYGLRFGIDLSRLITSFTNDDYTGLEFVGDYRLTQKLYLAAELGNEKKTKQEDLYNFTTSGSYIKLGVDYNTYLNWYGEQNTIFFGGRYAFSTFDQTLNNYQIYDSNRYWNPNDYVSGLAAGQDNGGLTASWIEFVFGAKVELFSNIYLGTSVRLGYLVSNKEPDNFQNLFIPGFNKVTEGSNFGVGYNYSITYFVPLYKKAKKLKKKVHTEEETE